MSITGSTFTLNRSWDAYGGAVNNAGTMTITSSLFNSNFAGPSAASPLGRRNRQRRHDEHFSQQLLSKPGR